MKPKLDRSLSLGLGLNALYLLCSRLWAPASAWANFLLGAVEGLALYLLLKGMLQTTDRGRALVRKLRAAKGRKEESL